MLVILKRAFFARRGPMQPAERPCSPPQDDKDQTSPHQCAIPNARNLLRLTVPQSGSFHC